MDIKQTGESILHRCGRRWKDTSFYFGRSCSQQDKYSFFLKFFFLYLYVSVCLSVSFSFVLHLSQGISWAAASGNPIFSYQQWQSTGNPRGGRPAGKPVGCGKCVSGPLSLRFGLPYHLITPEPWIYRDMRFYVCHKCHSPKMFNKRCIKSGGAPSFSIQKGNVSSACFMQTYYLRVKMFWSRNMDACF